MATGKALRKFAVLSHRDLGYFFFGLILIYCISGIALNHINDWNPDFIIQKQTLTIPDNLTATNCRSKTDEIAELTGERAPKVIDAPTPDQVKIYYDNASIHLNFSTGKALYEKITRRPVFYQTNILHKNSLEGWKWASDIFALMLILISVTGLFVLKGKNGIGGRGKWLIGAGLVPPLLAWLIHAML